MSEKQGQFAAGPSAIRDVVNGDHVYYQHPQHGLSSGEVSGQPGRNGFHVRHAERGVEPVRYEQMLGHKLRRARKFTVVDRGEDGSICHDEDGNRVFLRNVGEPAPGAERFAKAHPAVEVAMTPPGEDFRTLALELGRTSLETATMLVSAMDRMTAATIAQTARIDALIALQVAALNNFPGEPHDQAHDPLYQEHHPAGG